MAKLYFYYGAMGSSKTANALMVANNYEKIGKKPLLAKPAIDTRNGKDIIWSRVGIHHSCISLEELLKLSSSKICKYDAIIIDEIQFATPEQIDCLSDIVDLLNVPVLCYGLRTDFKNNPFPSITRLMAIADSIKEIKTVCWCGKKATCNARYNKDGIIKTGSIIELGDDDSYVALCRKHYKDGNLGPNIS